MNERISEIFLRMTILHKFQNKCRWIKGFSIYDLFIYDWPQAKDDQLQTNPQSHKDMASKAK